jgi:hypothetical protein
VPFSISPAGISNRPVGVAGRPADPPRIAQAFRWEEIRDAGVAKGWIYVNGVKFFPATGHLNAPALLALAGMDAERREKNIRGRMRLWLRPAHIRRRALVLAARTAAPASLNVFSLIIMVALSVYIGADVSGRLSVEAAAAMAESLPLILGYLALLHVSAIVLAWRALRRLRSAGFGADKRGSTLFGALLLPPQALRLRALLAEGFFPAQHPVSVALALGNASERRELCFQALTDLRWPVDDRDDSPLSREIAAWHRAAFEKELRPYLKSEELRPSTLLASPVPDSPASCVYCPRCRDQFTAGIATCPHGVPLQPLKKLGRPTDAAD